MSKYENSVRVKGVLGSITYHSGGVASLSVATNTYSKDKTSGEVKAKTTWHKIVLFNSLLEKAKKLQLQKGIWLIIEGSIRHSTYIDKKTNQEKQSTEIVASSIDVLVDVPAEEQQVAQAINQSVPVNMNQQQMQSYVQASPQNAGQPVQGQVQQVNNGGYVQY